MQELFLIMLNVCCGSEVKRPLPYLRRALAGAKTIGQLPGPSRPLR